MIPCHRVIGADGRLTGYSGGLDAKRWLLHHEADGVMPTLHDYPASANCLKARILLALLGQPYERVEVDIFDGGTLTDAYGALNPLRETPVLVTDDGEVVAQSNAIIWFLAEGTPYLPASALERARVIQWQFFEQERVMPGIGGPRFRLAHRSRDRGRPGDRGAAGTRPRGARPARGAPRDARLVLVGDGAVDRRPVGLRLRARSPRSAGISLEPYPAVRSWVARLEALPGFVDDLAPYPANAHPGPAARSTTRAA